ncbi:MAG: gluconolaconase [Planctomycetaceae bacterium]|nr:gluconolaconase [Planctomycetaceae bacterium]
MVAMLVWGSSAMTRAEDKKGDDMAKPTREQLLKTFASEFVEITPGKGKFPKSFEMGSKQHETQQPVHKVTFEYNFSIAKYEIPQNLYEAVAGSTPSRWKGPRNSAEMFTYREVVTFCEKITTMMREVKLIKDDEVIRLPSEAEWEYCCRAGTKTAYSFGDKAQKDGDEGKKATILDAYGWHTGNAAGNDPPVGALKPNPWGLYDMHGYLWEFVADTWKDSYEKAPNDGTALDVKLKNGKRIIRGGSWRDNYTYLQSGTRVPVDENAKSDAIGFRCVKAKVVAEK